MLHFMFHDFSRKPYFKYQKYSIAVAWKSFVFYCADFFWEALFQIQRHFFHLTVFYFALSMIIYHLIAFFMENCQKTEKTFNYYSFFFSKKVLRFNLMPMFPQKQQTYFFMCQNHNKEIPYFWISCEKYWLIIHEKIRKMPEMTSHWDRSDDLIFLILHLRTIQNLRYRNIQYSK